MTKKQKGNTKAKILRVTGKLLSQRGYYGVSMSDIAKEMNFTKASLYYHFESKDALVEELMRNSLAELKQELRSAVKNSKLPSDVLFNIIKTLLDFKISHPEISLLVSLGATTDKKVPVLQLVTELQTELLKFIRKLVGGVDIVRKFAYGSLFVLTTTLLGFVLSPLGHEQKSSDELATDFMDLLSSNPDNLVKTKKLA